MQSGHAEGGNPCPHCIPKGETKEYEDARRIANARFNYKPAEICYCRDAGDVWTALKKRAGRPVRVRSGGHHHEGMCSGEGVLIIDVSNISGLEFGSMERVTIGAGTRLCEVYTTLFGRNRLLPGGGCGDVRIGGLVQGGGWGPYSRALGLTCDRLRGFTYVPAGGGEPVTVDNVSIDSPYHDLMWAVSGAGGGNFGIFTHFTFEVVQLLDPIKEFTIKWKDPGIRQAVINEWRTNFPDDDELRLTSFCRLTAPGSDDLPIVIAGSYFGPLDKLAMRFVKLLPETFRYACDFTVADPSPTCTPHPEYQPGPPLLGAAPGSLTSTCDGGFYPHKVSSAFPVDDFDDAVKIIDDYFKDSTAVSHARRYLSLHGMGGAIRGLPGDPDWIKKWSCFPYRQKPFMLQYQAWWDENHRELDDVCLSWVRNFRKTMSGDNPKKRSFTEGAFINFPDEELVPVNKTMEQRKELLKFYYGKENLERLIGIKHQYDPNNVLDFPMGIPPK